MRSPMAFITGAFVGLSALVTAQETSQRCILPGQPTSGPISIGDWHELASTWCAIWERSESPILRQMGMIEADRQLTEGSAVVRLALGWPEDCEQDSPDEYSANNPTPEHTCWDIYVNLFVGCQNEFRGGTFRAGCAEYRYEAL